MHKYSELFYQYLHDQNKENFTYEDIYRFNDYLINNFEDVKNLVEEDRINREYISKITEDSTLIDEKIKTLNDLILENPKDPNFQIGRLFFTKDVNEASLFFYERIDEMLNGEFKNLTGFFGDFILTRRIMELGTLIFYQYVINKEYRLAEKIAKTLLILNQNDRYSISSSLMYVYLTLEKYEEIIKFYMRIMIVDFEVNLAMLIAYLKLGKYDFAESINEELMKENPYLVLSFFHMLEGIEDKNIDIDDKLLKVADSVMTKLDYFISPKERLELIQSIDSHRIAELLEPYFALDEDEEMILSIIKKEENRIIFRKDLYNKIVDYFFDKIQDALETSKYIDQIIDKLVKSHYLIVDGDKLVLTVLGKTVLIPYLENVKVYS